VGFFPEVAKFAQILLLPNYAKYATHDNGSSKALTRWRSRLSFSRSRSREGRKEGVAIMQQNLPPTQKVYTGLDGQI
jgi:hypothetical protein